MVLVEWYQKKLYLFYLIKFIKKKSVKKVTRLYWVVLAGQQNRPSERGLVKAGLHTWTD
jgi:hypothetical protein